MNRRLFYYSLVRYLPDPARMEAVNLGVIVVDNDDQESRAAFLTRFIGKLRGLEPRLNRRFIKRFLDDLEARTGNVYQPAMGVGVDDRVRNSAHLEQMAGVLKNQFQLTRPKGYRSTNLGAAVSELFASLVSPERAVPKPSKGMTREQIKRVIKKTINAWTDDVVRLKENLAEVQDTQHFADFWFQNGHTLAALVAIPANPSERSSAWAMRDSLPTIVSEFQKEYPSFVAVAVFPPENEGIETDFVQETANFLGKRPGVLIAHADKLDAMKGQILPTAGFSH